MAIKKKVSNDVIITFFIEKNKFVLKKICQNKLNCANLLGEVILSMCKIQCRLNGISFYQKVGIQKLIFGNYFFKLEFLPPLFKQENGKEVIIIE